MPLDASVFDKLKTFQDYQKADQAFQIQKALQTQQLQTGGIDAASKANVYAAQVLSAATATGDQNAYDQAKQTLQQNGVDTSTWAPDVASGAQQAQAAKIAQSSYGVLFNAQQKVIGNNIAGTAAIGNTNNPFMQAVPSIGPTGNVSITPQMTQPNTAQPNVQSSAPPPVAAGAAPSDAAFNAVFPPQSPNVQQAPNAKYGAPAQPVALQGANEAQMPQFSFRPQASGETIAAYKDAQQQAFEQFKLNNTGVIKQAETKGSETGKAQADANKAAIGANANYDQVVQTVNGIKDLNNSPAGLPQDRGFVPASVQASLAQNLGGTAVGNALGVPSQAVADNSNAFTKLNEAQTIGAIKELASTNQIRMTRTLENILNKGYLIEPGASKASKDQQANLILAELNNSKIAAQNVNAGMNGGQSAPYQQMPIQSQPSAPPSGATLYGTSGGKNVYKLPDGSFVMEQ